MILGAALMAVTGPLTYAGVAYPIPKAAKDASYLSGGPTSLDYPHNALARFATGVSYIRIRITSDGRADQCDVYQTSGHADLDARACLVTLKQTRFEPARNAHGVPIAQYAILPIRWTIGD